MRECERIIESIEHFYGHIEIECYDRMGVCSVEYKGDLDSKKEEIWEQVYFQEQYFDVKIEGITNGKDRKCDNGQYVHGV